MALIDDIFALEKGFWLAGEDHFRVHLDSECLMILPQAGQMQGIFARDYIAASASFPDRWRDLQMTARHLLSPTVGNALISYRADVTRGDGTPYAALIGSAYVRRDDGWKLVFHQHSPL